MFLEKQMKNVDDLVSGFEDQLTKDGTILDQPHALSSRSQQLQVQRVQQLQSVDPLFILETNSKLFPKT